MLDRRQALRLAALGVSAPAVLRVTRANAAEVTLKMHHFLPPVSNGHARFLKPWADKVAAWARLDPKPPLKSATAEPAVGAIESAATADLTSALRALQSLTPEQLTAVMALIPQQD